MQKIVFISLFLIQAFFLNAQIESMRFGLDLNPSLNWMNSNSPKINANGTTLGFAIHALGEYSLNDRYFIKLGLGMAFNQGGTMLHDDGYIPRSELSEDNAKDVLMGKNDVDVTYLIQYVEIPLAFRMRTRDFGYVRYFIDIPEIKFGIGVKKRGDVEASSLTLEKEVFNKDINTFNVWWGLGGGLEYDVSENTTLTAGLHFLQSFFDITDNKATDGNGEREDSKGNMSGIGLRVGVLF